MSKHIIFGAPGTGKTTKLLSIIEEFINKGLSPSDICFCSYSRAAAHEAIERAMGKFGLEKKDLPFFGTIHSICFKRFCFDKKVMNSKDRVKFFNEIKVEYKPVESDEDLLTSEESFKETGNIILEFYDKLRLFHGKRIKEFREDELKREFYNLPINEENYSELFGGVTNVFNVLNSYEKFKDENKLIDFIDMLLISLNEIWNVPTKILIVDEFQDLSPLQFQIYKIWSQEKKEVYIAGDDDQTIYKFICANPNFLIEEKKNLEDGDEEIILDKTFRLPKVIHEYCLNYIRMHTRGERIDKDVISLKEGGELIEENINYDLSNVLKFIRNDKFTFILFRTNYYKKLFIKEVLIPNGLIYNEIRGNGLWNKRSISLFNACFNLVNKTRLNYDEVKYLIESIPFKVGLLKKGLKSRFKDMKKQPEYTLSELISLGFNIKIFNFLNYKSLFSILNIKDNLKESFLETPKEQIQLPIKLKIGTIHSAKGKETDDVILFKDISRRIAKELIKKDENWDNEIKVFHVGQTRAKERLVILRGGFENAETDIIP